MSINQSQKPKKGGLLALLGAFISAVLASSCCLPALLFLLFGSSFGFLGFFEPLSKYRWLLTAIAGVFFLIFIWLKFFRKCGENCEIKRPNSKVLIGVIFLFLVFIFILFYPEILGYIMERIYA